MHRAIIDELGFRINSTPFEGHLDEILNYVIKAFKELDFATEIHYAPLENGIFELTVITCHGRQSKCTRVNLQKISESRKCFF